jgi:predicted nucleic acid-binding protein
MIVVSDTSPLNYLILCGCAELLEQLYGRVCVPRAVLSELQSSDAPSEVQKWVAKPPGWLEVHEVADPDLSLALDPGERDAITLAERIGADLVLLDERKGRASARSRGLMVVGTLGVLEAAAGHGLVDLPAALLRLQQTSFRAPAKLLREMLERQRKRQ